MCLGWANLAGIILWRDRRCEGGAPQRKKERVNLCYPDSSPYSRTLGLKYWFYRPTPHPSLFFSAIG